MHLFKIFFVVYNSTLPFLLGGKLINPIAWWMIGSDSKNSGILALHITNRHKLTPLCSKTRNELSFVKTTKLINPSGIDGLDNFLTLAKQTQVCLFPQCTVSWTEGYVVWMKEETMDQRFHLRLWSKKVLPRRGQC